MRNFGIVAALAAGLAAGAIAASHAKLPPPPAKSDAEKAAEAEKAAAAKAKDAELLNKAHEKAVANYKKNKGIAMDAKPAPAAPKKAAAK
jgi:opacity protein-like surface antigen